MMHNTLEFMNAHHTHTHTLIILQIQGRDLVVRREKVKERTGVAIAEMVGTYYVQ